jgi:serine/threonine protein kinase
MSERSDRAKSIFLEAIDQHAPEQWPAFLEQACGGDLQLQADVERLLRAQDDLGTFREQPRGSEPTTIYHSLAEGPGAVIGPYKLIEQIGEGGMGTVWMAQQLEPVKRVVALKLIKAGMDSKQIIARFEAERQALALMDHPNIARVLDGGATAPASGYPGRPYFVMDLVKGVPLTRYCDELRLTPRQRLELFIPVCQAIQHAHQKGIIHRDLKPSNVLVAQYDGKPAPKVIDFGVAKAAGQLLTEKTLLTGFGAIVGTLEYMSPEQADTNQLDIDTRSDIYSLGVLLYELLTGSPPFSRQDLEKAGVLEMLRVIREQEPSKPSTKLSTAEGLPTLAANRGIEPARLTKLVRGELDWIVMKALEKDRNRRYETPSALAEDIQRYLHEEPVRACPPSALYRCRKFVRRNKAAVAAALVVGLALGAVFVAVRLAHRYEQQRLAEQKAHQEELRAERQQHLLEKALMAAMSGDFDGAEKAIDEAELHGASTGQVRMLRGQVAFHRGDMEQAVKDLEQAVSLVPGEQPGAVAARAMLALACVDNHRFSRFDELSQELEKLTPITPQDFVFKGLLETTIGLERGLPTLDEGIRRHDSVLARATRLEARAKRAAATGKVEDAEMALDDALVAQRMLAGNALVLARSVYAHLVAASIYDVQGRPKERERVLAQARPLVKELERFSAAPFAAMACYQYFEYVGDDEAAFAMSEQGGQLRRAVMLYRRGEFAQALDAALECARSRTLGPTEQIERGLILAELPDGPARARAAYEEIRAGDGWQFSPPLILLLLGKPEEARQAYRQIRKEELPAWDDGWWFKCLDYSSGRISSETLLQAAGQSPPKLSDAYCLIGLWRLSQGERTEAQEHFRKCVATCAFDSWHWPWVRAFLARMEKDAAWPSWIPLKK